jgi:hypothetical protein
MRHLRGFLIFQADFELLLFQIVENSAKKREKTAL